METGGAKGDERASFDRGDDGVAFRAMVMLERLSLLYRALHRRVGKRLGLSPLELRIILTLGTLGRPVSESYLSSSMFVRKSTLVEVVSRLERRDVIERRECVKDRRISNLSLTDRGKELYYELLEEMRVLRVLSSKIPSELISGAMRFFGELMWRLKEEGVVDVLRICYTCANLRRVFDEDGELRMYCQASKRYLSYEDLQLDCPLYEPAA